MTVSLKSLARFVSAYVDSYQNQLAVLSQRQQELIRSLPPCLLSTHISTYVLKDSVVLSDEITTPIRPSIPFRILDSYTSKTSQGTLDIIKLDASLDEFTPFLTLGCFKFTVPPGDPNEYGHTSGISFLSVKSRGNERYLGDIQFFYYLDEHGWNHRWAWLLAKQSLQLSIQTAVQRLMFTSGVVSKGDKPIRGLERFRMSLSHFNNLLQICPEDEHRFQELFEAHPYLLSMWGQVLPKPFLRCNPPLPGIDQGRQPDFLVNDADGSCTLIEIEAPAKLIFTAGRDPQPTHHVTQSENQVRQWDQIVRNNPLLATTYPGIQYWRGKVIIGRSHHPAFPSYDSFQQQLITLSAQRTNIQFQTYDVLLEEAHRALEFLHAVFSDSVLIE